MISLAIIFVYFYLVRKWVIKNEKYKCDSVDRAYNTVMYGLFAPWLICLRLYDFLELKVINKIKKEIK